MTDFSRKRALRYKTVSFSLLVMLALGLVALLTPWIAPHDPYRYHVPQSDLPPMWVQGTVKSGTSEFPLGTDRYGRDILSRILYGTRTALFLALTAVPLATLLGTTIGLVAGYAGGRLDAWIMQFVDLLQSLPGIMFVVIIVLIFRSFLAPSWFNGLITLVIGFAAISWPSLARLVRINVMVIKTLLFVEAAISLGTSSRQIITRHLLPNVQHTIFAWIVYSIPAVILLEAVLGYIGVGVTSSVDGGEFTVVSWGGMFFSGRSALSGNPLMLIIPSVCILLISMSFLLLGDFLGEISRQEHA